MRKVYLIFVIFLIGLFKIFAQTITDIDGNVYDTVTIGTQVWMKQNLKTTHYSDGVAIPNVMNITIWENQSTGALCYFNNDSIANALVYGALYNGFAIIDVHNICPDKWHVPSDAEWNILEKYLDNSVDTAATGYVGIDIGGKLKETGTSHWNSPNTGATNISGFGALPGGYRTGIFCNIHTNGRFWSSSVSDTMNVWARLLDSMNSKVYRINNFKTIGYSVRCIMDLATDIRDRSNVNQIKLYPIPANDYLTIELTGIATIEIYNIYGQMISQFSFNTSKKIIDVSKLKAGVYIMKVKINSCIIVKHFIKEYTFRTF